MGSFLGNSEIHFQLVDARVKTKFRSSCICNTRFCVSKAAVSYEACDDYGTLVEMFVRQERIAKLGQTLHDYVRDHRSAQI